jgi:tetratricopeptide (TPR) repeat protein
VIRRLGVVLVVCSVWIGDGPAFAQETAGDAAAREHFLRGQAAFEAADYEQALVHLQESYRLSQRGQLQYNIGVTASNLGRAEEALKAFERYLEEVESPPREQEVRKRMAALEATIAEREEKRALVEAAIRYTAPEAAIRYTAPDDAPESQRDRSSARRIPTSAIAGSSVLAAVGVAGVVTMGIGIARSGSCVERDANGTCATERAASAWTGVYGAVGIAALAGSVTWLAVSSKRAKEKRNTAWMLTPAGVVVAGSF